MGATETLTFEDLARYLDSLGAKLTHVSFEKPLRTVAVYLAAQAKLCFTQSRSPEGTPWAPLVNPSRRRGGDSAKPLRDKGLLMASLTGRGAGHVEDVTRTALTWGTNVSYAGFHQQGTKRIPARPFLGVTRSMESTISKILLEHVAKLVKREA